MPFNRYFVRQFGGDKKKMNKNKVIALCALVFVIGFMLGSASAVISTGQLDKLDKQEAREMCETDIVKYNILLDEMVASVITNDETIAKFGHIEGTADLAYAIASVQNTLKTGYSQLDVSCPEELVKNVMTVQDALTLIEK